MGIDPPVVPRAMELGAKPSDAVPLEVRLEVCRRDGWKCRMCHAMVFRARRDNKGRPLTRPDGSPRWIVSEGNDVHVVAILPYRKGGDPEDPMNHVLACRPCRRNMAIMGAGMALEGVWPPLS